MSSSNTMIDVQRSPRILISRCLILLFSVTFGLLSASTAHAQSTQKVVQGKVVGSDNQPEPGAIVYLKSDKTNEIKSFISTADGTYRFGQLSADVDYELWAEAKGKKSQVRTVSSFDSKKQLSYALKIDTGK